MHTRDLRMPLKELGDGDSVFALALDAHPKSLEATDQEIRSTGVHRAAKIDNHLADAIHPSRIADRHAGDDIGVASKSFCGAVNDHVITRGNGILQNRGGKSVVDDGNELVFLGKRHGSVNIDEAKRGVSGRFDVKNFRTRRDELFHAGQIGSDLADGDAHVGENVAHQAKRTAVELCRGYHFIAGLQCGKQRGGNSRHAGRGDHGSFGAF